MSEQIQNAEDAMRLALFQGRELRNAIIEIIEEATGQMPDILAIQRIAVAAIHYDDERDRLIAAYLFKQKPPEVHG